LAAASSLEAINEAAQRMMIMRPYLQQLVPAWIGGHGTVPYEQKTQQSPAFGLSRVPHALQS
jgi:hypothetical protein